MHNLLNVVLATGDEQLDEVIGRIAGVTVVKQVAYAEGILPSLQQNVVNLVIISDLIPVSRMDENEDLYLRETKLLKVIDQIRDKDVRVLALVGERDVGEPFLVQLISMGVFDIIVGNDISIPELEEYIQNPRTYKDVRHLKGRVEQPKATLDELAHDEKRPIALVEPPVPDSDDHQEGDGSSLKRKVVSTLGSVSETFKRPFNRLGNERSSNEQEPAAAATIAEEPEKQLAENIIVFYSPASTGKTFVAANAGIALAKEGKPVRYLDATKHCGAKLWFNADAFPFRIRNFPLTVNRYDKSWLYTDEVVIIETDDSAYIPPNAKVILVTDSDYAHQVDIATRLEGINPIGMVWNLESEFSDPTTILPIPVIAKIPRYRDTTERILKAKPRALTDDWLCQTLLSVVNFEPMNYFVSQARGVSI